MNPSYLFYQALLSLRIHFLCITASLLLAEHKQCPDLDIKTAVLDIEHCHSI